MNGALAYGFAAVESEVDSLAREALNKSNPSGAAVLEVTNLFRVIDDFSKRDAILVRVQELASSDVGRLASIQASFAQAQLQSPPSASPRSLTINLSQFEADRMRAFQAAQPHVSGPDLPFMTAFISTQPSSTQLQVSGAATCASSSPALSRNAKIGIGVAIAGGIAAALSAFFAGRAVGMRS
jgi:hypothetical protein